uniref:SRR1-like domain-containing protein n=1 Tax=Anas zonorhyncha TaxID=75864 RepID=A0A8B9VG06_9AVES
MCPCPTLGPVPSPTLSPIPLHVPDPLHIPSPPSTLSPPVFPPRVSSHRTGSCPHVSHTHVPALHSAQSPCMSLTPCMSPTHPGPCPHVSHTYVPAPHSALSPPVSPQVPPDRCLVFDPAFSELEVAALGELGLRLLPENEEGKHRVRDSPTLFYMVHCGKALYNNLLWRNWAPAALSNMVIIGNSFKGMQERCAPSPAPFPLHLPFSNASVRDVCVVPKAWLRLSCCHNSSPRASLSPTPAAPRSCREASAPRRARPRCHLTALFCRVLSRILERDYSYIAKVGSTVCFFFKLTGLC